MSLPTREEAKAILEDAEKSNPGPWADHSRIAAYCAERIAFHCGLDPDKAYVLGLLHDIGRKFGIKHLAHVYDGYHYMLSLGYDEVAKVCLSHSFSVPSLEVYIGNVDVTEEQKEELSLFLKQCDYDEYDELIQLCDCLAGSHSIMKLEERMEDVRKRYGFYPREKWDRNLELKKSFEKRAGTSLEEIF